MAINEFLSSVAGAFSDFSIQNIASVVVTALGVAVPLVLAWFGYRFISRKASGALKKGRA